MNIKSKKVVLIIVLMLCNIIATIGVILHAFNIKHNFLFELFEMISFTIIISVSVIYISHYLRLKIRRARLVNSIVRNNNSSKKIIHKQDILFLWNREKDTILYSADIYNKYSIDMISKKFTESLSTSKNILEVDKEGLFNIKEKLLNGSHYEQIEIRLKNINGIYSWVRVSCTAIFNRIGDLSEVIGVIIDIDEEKRKKEELFFKAERDSLTKVYNRGRFIEVVNDYLSGIGKNKKSYLIMIDVDDFKIINDKFGHIYGDKVLINLINSLKDILNEHELIGRLGGDEFCIFIDDLHEDSYIRKRADEIMNSIINTYVCENEEIRITASIGIAQYPKHGQNFEELYVKSDKAMYKSKTKGKGRYSIYDEE